MLAVLAAIAAMVLPGRRRRRRWDEETAAITSELARLDAEIVPEVLARPSTTEAGVAWQASGSWRFDLDRRLRAQAASAPDPARRSQVEAGQQALTALVAAVDAETATPTDAGADELRSRRAAVDQARARLRAALEPPPA